MLHGFFPPVFIGKNRKGAVPCCQTKLTHRNEKWSFDVALETPVWGNMFQKCYLSDFENSEKLLIMLKTRAWKGLKKSFWHLPVNKVHLSASTDTGGPVPINALQVWATHPVIFPVFRVWVQPCRWGSPEKHHLGWPQKWLLCAPARVGSGSVCYLHQPTHT